MYLGNIYELAASYNKPLVAANFPVVRQARECAKSDLKFYNEMMKQKMTQIDGIQAVISAVKSGGFIVGSFSPTMGLSFSATSVVHVDATDARKECKRLAALNPGKMFLFVRVTGAEMVPTTPTISV